VIKEVALSNWKQHARRDVAFGDGLNAIIGPNSAGKSNLLKGILFALGGTGATGSASDNLWRWDSPARERLVSVKLDLPRHGEVTIQRTTSSAKVFGADGKLLASGTTPVLRFVEEAYGMAWADLSTLLYSPQGEVQEIVKMGSTKLQKRVEALAQVSVLDKVLDLIAVDVRGFEAQLEVLPPPVDLEELRNDLRVIQTVVADVRERVAVATTGRTSWQAALDERRAAHSAALNAQHTMVRLRDSLSAAQAQHESVERELLETLSRLQSLESTAVDPTSLQEEVEVIERDLRDAEQRAGVIATHQRELAALEKAVAELDAALPKQVELGGQIERSEQALEVARGRQLVLGADCAKHTQQVKELKAQLEGADCPTCKRPYDECFDRAAVTEAHAFAHQVMLAEMAALDDVYKDIRREEAELKRLLKQQLPGIGALLGEKAEQLRALRETPTFDALPEGWLAERQSRLAGLRKLVAGANQQQGQITQLKAQESTLAARLEQQTQVVTDLTAQVAALPEPPNLEALVAAIEEAERGYAGWLTEEESGKERLTQVLIDEATLRQAVETAERAEGIRQKVEADKSLVEGLQSYLRKNRARLSAGIWDSLLDYASALSAAASGGKLGRLSRTDQGGDFMVEEISLDDTGASRNVPVSELGGARRSICGLALRVALAETFFGPGLPLLIDEAAADASDETAATIAGMLSSLGRQVISVTHREGEAVNATHVIQL
jgi:DNA repair exonuclease SbcCD ATPase subunit